MIPCQFCGAPLKLVRAVGEEGVVQERWVCSRSPHSWRDLVANGWLSARNRISNWKRKWSKGHGGEWPQEPTV